ncbi:MAG: hypothetical protein HY900_35545 [Deltaproteobacteria bacterium]|nr:hypothetical protein [Deltaproteobacteria bacterium]
MPRIPSRAAVRRVQPLLRYITDTLSRSGCELLHVAGTREDTFRLSYENPLLQRVGLTGQLISLGPRTRDPDGATATIQVAAGPGGASLCDREPFGLFSPVLLGIDPARDLFVAFDPSRHFPEEEPLRVSISGEPLRLTLARGWHAWEREEWEVEETGFAETLVGFTGPNLVRYVLFERLAVGLDTGPRHRLAEMYYEDVVCRGGTATGFRRFPL